MSEPLTQLERQVYRYMIDFLAENTFQPSIREIARHCGVKSTKTVSDLLQSLERKGYIERDKSRSRGVRIIGFGAVRGTQPVPVYDQIQVGVPSPRPDNANDFITVDRRFLPSDDAFFLKVGHGSTLEQGIHEGDLLLVSPSAQACEGDVIASRVGENLSLRTLMNRAEAGVVEPANAGQRVETRTEQDAAVVGVVTAVFRAVDYGRAPR